MGLLKRFWNDQSGATVIEYTLVLALIAIATIIAVRQTGDGVAENLMAIFE